MGLPEGLEAHRHLSGAEMMEKVEAERLNSGGGDGEEENVD